MESTPKENAKRLDFVLPASTLILIVMSLSLLGLTMLFSITQAQYKEPYFILRRQSIWLAIAFIAGVGAFFINWEKSRKAVWVIGLGTFLLLFLVLIPGVGMRINGARRWLDLGLMHMQVSDFVKVAMVIVLAHVLSVQQRHLRTFWRGFCFPCAIVGLPLVLIASQPDYGTAFLFGGVGVVMRFLAGVRLLYLIPSALAAVSGLFILVLNNPERFSRITAFLNIDKYRDEGAYQLWQGMLSFGAGSLKGVGLGNGRQQMAFLPEAHTDFVFPIIGEELGFFFTAAVVLSFFTIFAICFYQLRRAPTLFHFLLTIGSLLFVTLQALINFGVVTGLLPTKGISLPFISYGGSNLVCMFIFIGIILNNFYSWNQFTFKKPMEL